MKGQPIRRFLKPALATCAVAALGLPLASAEAAPTSASGTITRISRTPAGPAPDSGATGVSVSGDGRYVVYESSASDIVADDDNGLNDVFLYDADSGATTLITRNLAGEPANGYSLDPTLSTNGRFVVFLSAATDLTDHGGTVPETLIYRYELSSGAIKLVSKAPNGAYPTAYSDSPDVSATGRFVAYSSRGHNIVRGDHNGKPDVFLYDFSTDTTTLVSTANDGTGANGASAAPTVSRSGMRVSYQSTATNIVAFDGTNFGSDIYLWNSATATNQLVTESVDGGPAHGSSHGADISDSGRFLAFDSHAGDLVAGPTGGGLTQVFVYDISLDTMRRISTEYDDWAGGADNSAPSISADGRFVAYNSDRWDTLTDTQAPQVLLWDKASGRSALISASVSGAAGTSTSWNGHVTTDGRRVVFQSMARNLPHGVDQNQEPDAYSWSRTG